MNKPIIYKHFKLKIDVKNIQFLKNRIPTNFVKRLRKFSYVRKK